jgi:hypothetical protein
MLGFVSLVSASKSCFKLVSEMVPFLSGNPTGTIVLVGLSVHVPNDGREDSPSVRDASPCAKGPDTSRVL